MAFGDFKFPEIRDVLGIEVVDAPVDVSQTPLPVGDHFIAFLKRNIQIAKVNSTEKARSEFIIAPILSELQYLTGNAFNLFSGREWNFDRDRGLNGYCDFFLTHGASQRLLEAPFAVVVEAKNELIDTGFGQCIAAMYAANEASRKAGVTSPVHGIVTTGELWQLLRIDGSIVLIDTNMYYVNNLPLLMGVLAGIVRKPTLAAAA